MTFYDYLMMSLAIIATVIVLVFMFKTKMPLKAFLSFAGWGVSALVVLHLLSFLTGFKLEITPFTLSASAIFSLPGVVCMVLTKMLWGI